MVPLAAKPVVETPPRFELLVSLPVVRDCTPNYADCMDLQFNKPCCRQQQLEVGQIIPEDFVCFRFGKGICQPLSSVDKLDKYAQLIKFANVDNVIELIGQYHEDEIPEEIATDSTLDGVPIDNDDGLTKPDGVPVERHDGPKGLLMVF
ncbi:cysteine motif gene-c4.1 [Ichnoviriform fugitivi]|uniref:Cysteine motif gene-c4.1 n=1 Tax=Ichnoviriform fugitivi TaxID=265522 RepID=A2Q0G4_9VIRU|nr:cysteine motif gene-c4.1 [Ichnoviriform fugitivi]BAF45679.1 cysteine motif gene-c4.1 [Ichnoviriform fugitivi]